MPIGTAVHERTFPLCQSLNYREWSGFYAVSVYETHHEHEYNAIRNAAALIDVTPLFKYMIAGRDATRFVNRVIARDINKVAVEQVIYCCWCDEEGKIIDDGTITRLEENRYRWTAADPNLRWFRQNAIGLDVQIEEITEQVAALALQGPTSGKLLKSVAEADIENLKYFRKTSGKIGGVPVDISRTGYTGDLGYEIWIPWSGRSQGLGRVDGGRPGIRYTSHGHAGSRCGPHRSRSHPRRRGLHQQQEGADPFAKIHSRRSRPGQARSLRKGKLHWPESAAGRKADRTSTTSDGAGNRLERSRIAVRPDGTRAADACHRVARACTRVQGTRSGGESNLDYVVAVTEKTDRAGQSGTPACNAGRHAADGNNRGSGTAQGVSHRPFLCRSSIQRAKPKRRSSCDSRTTTGKFPRSGGNSDGGNNHPKERLPAATLVALTSRDRADVQPCDPSYPEGCLP